MELKPDLELANAFRQARKQSGLTKSELSRITGLSRVYIQQLESGEYKDLKVSTLLTLSKALKRPSHILLYEIEHGSPSATVETNAPSSDRAVSARQARKKSSGTQSGKTEA